MYVSLNKYERGLLTKRDRKRILYEAYPYYNPYDTFIHADYYFVEPSPATHDVVIRILESYNFPTKNLDVNATFSFEELKRKELTYNIDGFIYFFKNKDAGFYSLAFSKHCSTITSKLPWHISPRRVFRTFNRIPTMPSASLL